MSKITTGIIIIGDNHYHIEPLNPLEAIEWGNRVFAIISPALGTVAGLLTGSSNAENATQNIFRDAFSSHNSAETTRMMTEACKRCYTPRNEALSNEAVLNEWFRANPGDLYELSLRAVWELVKDFFPSSLTNTLNQLKEQLKNMKVEQENAETENK